MSRPFAEAGPPGGPLGTSTQARGTHFQQGDEVDGGQERVGDRAAGLNLERSDDPVAGLGDEHRAGERTRAVQLGEAGEGDVVLVTRRTDDDRPGECVGRGVVHGGHGGAPAPSAQMKFAWKCDKIP